MASINKSFFNNSIDKSYDIGKWGIYICMCQCLATRNEYDIGFYKLGLGFNRFGSLTDWLKSDMIRNVS